jgi:anthranilate synthase component 1
VAASRIDRPAGLPPPSAGLFGAMGYDMIRLAERLPNVNPDPLDLPDGVMTRPRSWRSSTPSPRRSSCVPPSGRAADRRGSLCAAQGRLHGVIADLKRPTPALVGNGAPEPDRFETPVSRARYGEIVEAAKEYIRAGDIFQVVPSHRLRAPFARDPFALYPSLRRTNPSPSCST